MLFAELEVLEDRSVRQEAHERARALVRILELAAPLRLQHALRERRLGELAVAHRPHVELVREAVDGLCANAVHAHRELEGLGVELAAGVQLGDAVNDLAERNAAPIVADRALAGVPVEVDLDALAVAHDEFVDRVVDHLLHQHVYAVVVVGSVARAPDVHPDAAADVLHRAQVLDIAVVVVRHLPHSFTGRCIRREASLRSSSSRSALRARKRASRSRDRRSSTHGTRIRRRVSP